MIAIDPNTVGYDPSQPPLSLDRVARRPGVPFQMPQTTDKIADSDPLMPTCSPEQDELNCGCILIVDDSAMTRRKLRFFLEKAGNTVFEASSGEEAIAKAHEIDPDLVVMDVQMGGMDGFEACRKLRNMPENSDLRIIFLTGSTDQQGMLEGFAIGAVDFIRKPFNSAEVVSRIGTHLRMRKLSRFRQQHINELEQLNRAKDRLLQVASHDLRNPLSAVCGLVGFLEESSTSWNPQQNEMLQSIKNATNRMTHLVNDLLDLSALDSGKLKLKSEPYDLAAQLCEVTRIFQPIAVQKEIQLKLSEGAQPLMITGDSAQICRVMENLIGNALKFTPQGGEVIITWQHTDREVHIDILDNGPGIVAEDQKLLFQEFSRTRNRPTAGEPSTGLGLSICLGLIKAHGGNITHSNRPSGGSCFTVALPLRK